VEFRNLKVFFSEGGAFENFKNMPRPSFSLDLSMHVNKVPFHLVKQSFKRIKYPAKNNQPDYERLSLVPQCIHSSIIG
jgi:hypothetical protein